MLDELHPLKRYPFKKNDLLKAYNSADEYLIKETISLNLQNKKILIINDHYGALTKSLQNFNITTYTDSYISSKSIKLNCSGSPLIINDLSEFKGQYDIVVIKIPKNLSFFEDILIHLSSYIHSETQIICGAMIKHLSPASFSLLEKYIGPTKPSLAYKKARLFFSSFTQSSFISPYPLKIKIDSFEQKIVNYSNVFCLNKLDIGTRFFMDHTPKGDYKTILDLGCGNGIVGLKAKMNNPEAKIIFSDESFMSIQSARINYNNYFKDQAEFHWTNCFENQKDNSLDLVLCNPPFHQGHNIEDGISTQMFNDAYKSLKQNGIIRVVGNSHLAYQLKLKKVFGNSQIVSTNNKFIICESTKKQ
jgi:23S rRNA (guanine1835-N2)-methyltransferase